MRTKCLIIRTHFLSERQIGEWHKEHLDKSFGSPRIDPGLNINKCVLIRGSLPEIFMGESGNEQYVLTVVFTFVLVSKSFPSYLVVAKRGSWIR